MPFPMNTPQTWKRDLECLGCGKKFFAVVLSPDVQQGICPGCERDYVQDRLPADKAEIYKTVKGRYKPAREEV